MKQCETFWVVRHGSRIDFVNPYWHRTAERRDDPPLSTVGVKQAEHLGRRLKEEKVDMLFSSPFLRCVETAATVAEILDLPIHLEWGLSEWLNPQWFEDWPEILGIDVLHKLYPRINPHYKTRVMPKYPEFPEDLCVRMQRVTDILVRDFGESLLVVGHGATVLGTTARLLRQPMEQVHRQLIPEVPYCSLVKLARHPENWRIELQADTSHLSERQSGNRFA